jgi:hypothetical protein
MNKHVMGFIRSVSKTISFIGVAGLVHYWDSPVGSFSAIMVISFGVVFGWEKPLD